MKMECGFYDTNDTKHLSAGAHGVVYLCISQRPLKVSNLLLNEYIPPKKVLQFTFFPF